VTRTARRLVALSAAALALTACGTSRPGAAAVVGDERITVDQLHAMANRALDNPDAAQKFSDKASFMRRELNQLIEHQLLLAAAKKLDVSITPGDVDKRLDQYATQLGGLDKLKQSAAADGVAPEDLRTAVSDLVLGDALADKLTADTVVSTEELQAAYQANIEQFDRASSAHILVADEKTARSILAQVKANPGSFAALASKYSVDTGSKGNGGELGFVPRKQLVKPYADAVYNGKPGEITLAHSEFGWHVIKILAHEIVTFDQAKPQLRRTILGQSRDKALSDYLVQTAKRLKVSVNPRFGVWDAATHTVTEHKDELSTPSGAQDTPTPQPTTLPGG
jgi:parvulin-like peptidyl-prolyl isomerase